MFVLTPNDGRIRDAYAKHYSRIWVVLSPFLRPQAIPFERFCPATYPTRNEILADCAPVTWSDVLLAGGFETLSDIDVALRSYIHGLKRPNQRLKGKLVNMIERERLIPPAEGIFSPHNERSFLLRLKELGHSNVLVCDEFGEQTSRKAIEEILAEDCIPPHGVISTEDGSILVGSHWDSCCSFLCTQECDDQFRELEKFPCTDRTHVYWGLYPI
ncbi:MAG: DUF2711 family protein [Natronohydrobacter sp.]|nr:DUF2711 family protein [Natronohydrobacter sp.]